LPAGHEQGGFGWALSCRSFDNDTNTVAGQGYISCWCYLDCRRREPGWRLLMHDWIRSLSNGNEQKQHQADASRDREV
jgi:hypothetical protein